MGLDERLRVTGAVAYVRHMTMDVHGVQVPVFGLTDRLRKAREVAHLDQGELATEIGVARTTIGNYEAGRVKPRKIVLKAWALRCGVPLEWLETGTAKPHPVGPDGASIDELPRQDLNLRPSDYMFAEVRALRGEQFRRAA